MTIQGTSSPMLAGVLLLAACAVEDSRKPASANPSAPTDGATIKEVSGKAHPPAPGVVSSISLEEFFTLHQSGKTLVFDARPAFFYNLTHVPGALHLPKGGCDAAIARREGEIMSALASGKTIVVYCAGPACPDARTVATHLSSFGYPASVFSGGWDAWRDASLPIE